MAVIDGSFFSAIGQDLRTQVGQSSQFLRQQVGRALPTRQAQSQPYTQFRNFPQMRPQVGVMSAFPGGISQLYQQRFGGMLPQPGFGRILTPGTFGTVSHGLVQPTVSSPTSIAAEKEKAAAQAAAAAKGGSGGVGATGADAGTDKWRDLIDQAAAANNIDGDVIQAIMMIESGGNATARSGAGAMGLMQVMNFHFQPGEDPFDPKTNVNKGASILADNYRRYGNWDSAVAAYLGAVDANGNPTTATDMYGTSGIEYARRFNENLAKIKAARQARGATGASGGQSFAGLTPGAQGSIMQEFGPTPYAQAHPDTYAYGNAYGLAGSQHPGIDWAVPMGSQVVSPVGGTVTVVGNDHGSGYFYRNTMSASDPDRSGELAIQLDNGDIIILGHMSDIGVGVGQRVNAGQAVGRSGGSDGAHVHLETRKRNANGGYSIVDPRAYFGW